MMKLTHISYSFINFYSTFVKVETIIYFEPNQAWEPFWERGTEVKK